MTIIVGPKPNWEWISIDWDTELNWKLILKETLKVENNQRHRHRHWIESLKLNWIGDWNWIENWDWIEFDSWIEIEIGLKLKIELNLTFEIELNWNWDWIEIGDWVEFDSEDWIELKIEIGNATCMYGITRLLNVWAHKMHDYACMNTWNAWLVCSLTEKFHGDRQNIRILGT